MKAYIYARTSTDDQKDSLVIQEQQGTEYFTRVLVPRGYELGGVFKDEKVSGRKALFQRASGFRLSNTLEAGDTVIASKMDRIFRNLRDMLMVTDTWQARGVHLVLLDLNIDSSTPVGKLMMSMLGAIAEFERSRISERCKEKQALRRSQGYATTGAIYGFKTVGPKGKKRMVPDPERRAIGQRVVQWKQQGQSWYAIYEYMRDNKVRNTKGVFYRPNEIPQLYRKELRLQATEKQLAEDIANGVATAEVYKKPAAYRHKCTGCKRWQEYRLCLKCRPKI